MPMYTYHDKNHGLELEVLRSFSEYDVPPTEDELPEEERGKDRDWERLIKASPTVTKSRAWGPGKGYW